MSIIASVNEELPLAMLDILPNPVLVKDTELRYVFVNEAFESLFGVKRAALYGHLDKEMFKDRQVAQCNGGDLRVLNSGEIDEAYETVFRANSEPRVTITRKSRLTLNNGDVFLVGVMHDITDLTRANQQLEEKQELLGKQAAKLAKLASTDFLTGCLNRRAVCEETPAMFASHGNTGSVLLLDIDHFKKINDSFGHDFGDAALVHLAQTVVNYIRSTDQVARLGGEEFAVMMPGASVEEAQVIAERLRTGIAESPFILNGQTINMTVSIGGIHKLDPSPVDFDRVLKQADECLYLAKRNGRNQVVWAH